MTDEQRTASRAPRRAAVARKAMTVGQVGPVMLQFPRPARPAKEALSYSCWIGLPSAVVFPIVGCRASDIAETFRAGLPVAFQQHLLAWVVRDSVTLA